jgi:hypothetical protein
MTVVPSRAEKCRFVRVIIVLIFAAPLFVGSCADRGVPNRGDYISSGRAIVRGRHLP